MYLEPLYYPQGIAIYSKEVAQTSQQEAVQVVYQVAVFQEMETMYMSFTMVPTVLMYME